MREPEFVRYQGTTRNERGTFTGVFGLINGLARDGRLTDEQEQFRRAGNDWYDANFTNPSHVDPTVYERNPRAAAWFKSSAHELIARVDGYLRVLAAHGVGCAEIRSAAPGRIVYEDEHQVLVVPH